MAKLPESVLAAWKNRAGFPVFTTVDQEGMPNAIYVGALDLFDDETIVIANNYFQKTLTNIEGGCKGSFLFLSEEKKAYQIKGRIEYTTSGPYFDFMKKINPEGYPGLGAAAIHIEAVYSGTQKLV